MRQRLFCFGDDFVIKDEEGQERFLVDGKAFSFGDKLAFQDTSGKELAFIQQKLLAWGPTYEIYRQGQLAAMIKKELFTFFNCRFTVDVPGPDDLEASGSFTDHEYRFCRRDNCVAAVSKRWFTWADTYGVEIADGEEEILILASSVVIDMVCHTSKHRS